MTAAQRIHAALPTRGYISTGALMDLLYADREDPPYDGVIKVLVCKLRRAGVVIETKWGVGYRLVSGRAQSVEGLANG